MSEPVSIPAWARKMGFSSQYAYRLVHDGVISMNDNRKVDPDVATAQLEAFAVPTKQAQKAVAQAGEQGSVQPDSTLLIRSRIKTEIERGKLAELSRRKKEGDLVDAAAVGDTLARISSIVRDYLLSLPERVAGQVAALTDERAVRDLLKAEVLQSLSHLSEGFKDVRSQSAI